MILIFLALVFILPIVLLYWYQNFSHVGRHVKRIPGPGLPIVGEFLTYVLADKKKSFQNDRDRAAKYPDISKFWIVHSPSVNLQKPQDVEIVLSSTKHIEKSKLYYVLHMWLGSGLLTSDGDTWRLRRKMLTPAFHFTILKGFVDVFNEATEILTKSFEESLHEDYIDVIPPITEFTLQSIAETSMGTSLDLREETNKSYKKAIYDYADIAVNRLSRPWLFEDCVFKLFPQGIAATQNVKILHEFTRNIIKERKKTFKGISYTQKKRLAMLDLLIKAQEVDGNIDDVGIREEVDTFMFEGHDTTAVAICYILMVLANHPQIQSEVRQEIIDVLGDDKVPTYNDLQELSYTERCLKECLRLYPSVPLIGRNINEDIPLPSGYTVPKRSMVHIFIFDMHRNPDLYPDPLKFDPDRFLPENVQKRHPFAYIPFSAGSRNCIGQRFAMLELKAVLCGLLRKFILEPVDRPEDIVFTADLVLRSDNPIRVRFLKRQK